METMNFGDLNNENNNQAPRRDVGARNRKLIWAGAILVVLVAAVGGWQYWQYTQSDYYKQMKGIKELEKMAEESDKWGGKTPEETVALFTEAVKKGDFELASKYGNPELIKPVLEKIKNDEKIDQLLGDLEISKLKEVPEFGGDDFNLVAKENGQEIWIMSLFKNKNGTWKIVEF